jgi:hypothetical protein
MKATTICYSAHLRSMWPAHLAEHWASLYPELFDSDDIRITRLQPQNHFCREGGYGVEGVLQPCIGLDIRKRSELGELDLGFAVLESDVICLQPRICEQDPVWIMLCLTGIDTVYHLPSVAVAMPPDKFRTAIMQTS